MAVAYPWVPDSAYTMNSPTVPALAEGAQPTETQPQPESQGPPIPGGAAAMGGMPPLFAYEPSFLIALVGTIFFSMTMVIHGVQMFRTKAWYFGIIAQAALLGAVSSGARAVLTLDQKLINAYVLFMLTQKPLGSIASIGVIFTFTRLVWWITPNQRRTWNAAWAPPGFISFTWAGASLLCDISKTVGNQVLKDERGMPTTFGTRLEGAGNVLQMFVFGGFTVMAGRFHWLAKTWEAEGDMPGRPAYWKQLSIAGIVAAALLTFRQVFEVVNFDQMTVPMSYSTAQEWVFWFFDQLPVLIVLFIYNIHHPGNYFPRDYTGFRLNRKRLLTIKANEPDSSSMKNGYVISSPRPVGEDIDKSEWTVKEVESASFGMAR